MVKCWVESPQAQVRGLRLDAVLRELAVLFPLFTLHAGEVLWSVPSTFNPISSLQPSAVPQQTDPVCPLHGSDLHHPVII